MMVVDQEDKFVKPSKAVKAVRYGRISIAGPDLLLLAVLYGTGFQGWQENRTKRQM